MDSDSQATLDSEVEKRLRKYKMKQAALLKATEEFYLKNERMRIQLELNDDISKEDYEESRRLKQLVKDKKKEADSKYACFITINPKENKLTDFQKLDNCVKKALSKCWVTDYCYCYEQRSNDPHDIHGLHTHILLRRNTRPSNLEREIRNTFKGIVGKPDKHIDIKYIKKEWINDKLEYMSGHKTGTDQSGKPKQDKVPIDIVMRNELGIKHIYYNEGCEYDLGKFFSNL